MSFINLEYFLFVAVGLVVYYIMPKKIQWVVLLLMSYVYYLSFKVEAVVYIIFTTLVTFAAGLLIEKAETKGKEWLAANKETIDRDQKKAFKAKLKKKKKALMLAAVVLDFGLLAFVKYTNFFIENINGIIGNRINAIDILVPLGISFYTFQSVSYVIDVYWGKVKAERNPFKFALFVSFFPQIMQGPIGRFDKLAPQFFAPHKFDLTRIEYGLQRIFWGFFKKLILADRTAGYVNNVFVNNYQAFNGFYVIVAVLMYCVELYADFSGGMDIVIGTAEMFGITMDENFKRPFFSKSIGEFWRRWHVTLGEWMKDYIFYPFSLSKAFNKIGKFTKKHFKNKHVAQTIPICISNLLIFFIVGVWHGAAWKYIMYGMYNGVIIAFSNLCKPLYKKGLVKCHINADGKVWTVVQILRTFILVNIGWYFDMALSFRAAIEMMINTVYQISFKPFTDGSIFTLGMARSDFLIVAIGCVIWFVISYMQEKGIKIRDAVSKQILPVRWALYLALVFSIIIFGYIGQTQGFIYAQF
ncbi:MAG: MBOAT family protein [Clostridia bacterium]|nr:MBOAT family protein [[Bacteroides] pectinophilus]MDD5873507.1 MBOAT family protein [Clostridia bacterium]